MYLTRHDTPGGPRWALDGNFLPPSFSLELLLQLPKAAIAGFLRALPTGTPASGSKLLAPVEPTQEVWAAGVTYLRSRDAREEESAVKDVYTRVYEAKRPELFFKANGWRVAGHDMPIRVRHDSGWNVPEPELTLVINSAGEIVGHTVGNDVSSRDIEGDNPLYLPQAKVYNGSCAVGPGIRIGDTERLKDLTIALEITRAGRIAFTGETRTAQIKRSLDELAGYLFMELDFPRGAFLLTGTGIVPPQEFSLSPGDVVAITIGGMTLENEVAGPGGPPRRTRQSRATMALEPVLIAGEWRQPVNPSGSFKAIDPTAGKPLPESYPVSADDDVVAAFRAAEDAVVALRAIPVDAIGRFLDDYAARIEAAADALVERAARETGLPVAPRLRNVELPRTTGQLRQGAAAARERSWCMATIDTKANLRSCYGPLGGPVVVFGPNNFPFAFNSIAGGDFVAAIAAGNPVIGKANTGHPGTSKLLAELALEAARGAGLPPGMVQLVYRTPPEIGYTLVSDTKVGATGFTGSKSAGLKLKAAADRAGKPIYLEMSSTNPVFVLPRALDERGPAIAKELYDSVAMGAGQFCTRPGLAIVPKGDKGAAFVAELAGMFKAGTPGTLLGPSGATAIAAALKELIGNGARVLAGGRAVEGERCAFEPTLLEVSGKAFLDRPHDLQTEAFGSVNTVVVADDVAQMAEVAAALEGNLTGCVYSDTTGKDDDAYARLVPVLRGKVGRLLNDKMPTGVAVSPAMNHGGPFPATGHPGFTAVGIPASLLRFAALRCYDAVRPHRLPPELANKNPTGKMWRLVDGNWSQGDVAE